MVLLSAATQLFAQTCGPNSGSTWCQFLTCISSVGNSYGWGGTCTLPAGQWPVASTLEIVRQVTVTGSEISDPYDTTLYRSSDTLFKPVMEVAPGVGGVAVENLAINGSRQSFLNCLSNSDSRCGGASCSGIYDLNMQTGSGGNTVYNVVLTDSPFSAVSMAPGDSLYDSTVAAARFYGVGMTRNGAVGLEYDDRTEWCQWPIHFGF